MDVKSLAPGLWVSPQLRPEDLPTLAGRFRAIVNNRPDHEEPGQPESAELEAEARRLGLAYRHIPVTPGQLSDDAAAAFREALAESAGPVLAFCRTGTRSTMLWALGEAERRDPDRVIKAAAEAGYDLETLRPRLAVRRS